jgi:hypothetical protein
MRRLEIIQEPAGKLRYIVLGDWWSQNALSYLHDELMLILRNLPTDSTYKAYEHIDMMSKREFPGGVVCFDLKSFTERQPIELQTVVLEALYGLEVAED